MILRTERLNLRPISENDIENVFKLQSLEQTAKFNTSKIPTDIDETKIIEFASLNTDNLK